MENPRHIIRRTKVLSKIDEKGYEQRSLVTEDVNLITGEVKMVKIEHYDWDKNTTLDSKGSEVSTYDT